MPGVCRCDLTNACALYHYPCTRGYRAHRAPGIPCALCLEGKEFLANLGRKAPRDRERIFAIGSCVCNWVTSLRGALATTQSSFLFRGDDGLLRRKGPSQ